MKGIIYLLSNSVDDRIYIGSTTQSLSDRMKGHRYCAKNCHESNVYQHMYKVGVRKWEIEAIKICKVKTRAELEEIEYDCMKNYPRNLLLNVDTEYRKRSIATSKKVGLGSRGSKTIKFKRGSIHKLRRQFNGSGIFYSYIVFAWRTWIDNILIRKSKSFSIAKHGENTARKMAKEYQNKIYPKPE